MANVIVEGVFMGANLKESEFDGKKKTNIYIDVYQQDSSDTEKTLQIKSDDIQLLNRFQKEFSMGSSFRAKVSISAYKNKAYYRLLDILK